ncbi:unnamed protein product [Prunus armeniaca]|uniref:Uncharacterized protein n=1 Tax=Prunus armeniaca TaxID=36596 RepID=A0A6J5TSS1_PRUAR|nr:unnamed protein product [Prunus armeniaca]
MTGRGDKSRGESLGGSGRDDSVGEDAGKRRVIEESRVGVDLDREMGFGGLEEEGDFRAIGAGWAGLDTGGKAEERVDFLVGFGEFWGLGYLGRDDGGCGGGLACDGENYGERQAKKNSADERKWRWGEHGIVVEKDTKIVTGIFSGKWRVRFGGRR